MNQFRSKNVFDEIIMKAKALLSTERGYFDPPGVKPRWATAPDSTLGDTVDLKVLKFVQEWVEPSEGEVMTVSACLERFKGCCAQSRVTKSAVRKQLECVVRALHGKGVRNDLLKPDGGCASGWRGLKLHDFPKIVKNLAKTDYVYPSSATSVESKTANESLLR